MTITWYPKSVLLAVVFFAAFAVALNIAIDFRRGAVVGLTALLVYAFLDVMLTFNLGGRWLRHRSPDDPA